MHALTQLVYTSGTSGYKISSGSTFDFNSLFSNMTDSNLEENFILAYTFLNDPEINLSNEIKLKASNI